MPLVSREHDDALSATEIEALQNLENALRKISGILVQFPRNSSAVLTQLLQIWNDNCPSCELLESNDERCSGTATHITGLTTCNAVSTTQRTPNVCESDTMTYIPEGGDDASSILTSTPTSSPTTPHDRACGAKLLPGGVRKNGEEQINDDGEEIQRLCDAENENDQEETSRREPDDLMDRGDTPWSRDPEIEESAGCVSDREFTYPDNLDAIFADLDPIEAVSDIDIVYTDEGNRLLVESEKARLVAAEAMTTPILVTAPSHDAVIDSCNGPGGGSRLQENEDSPLLDLNAQADASVQVPDEQASGDRLDDRMDTPDRGLCSRSVSAMQNPTDYGSASNTDNPSNNDSPVSSGYSDTNDCDGLGTSSPLTSVASAHAFGLTATDPDTESMNGMMLVSGDSPLSSPCSMESRMPTRRMTPEPAQRCLLRTPSSTKKRDATKTVFQSLAVKRKSSVSRSGPCAKKAKTVRINSDGLYDCLIPLSSYFLQPTELHAHIVSRLNIDDSNLTMMLTRLFYAIGSPESLRQLKVAFVVVRTGAGPKISESEGLMKALDKLDVDVSVASILRRYYLTSLVCQRDGRLTRHRGQDVGTRPRLLRFGCTKPRVGSSNRGLARATKLAFTDVLLNEYPNLRTMAESREEFKTRTNVLKNRLSYGRHWRSLEERFSTGILALIPTGDTVGLCNSRIEHLPNKAFNLLVDLLDEYRGPFLRRLGQCLTKVYNVLSQKDPGLTYRFENLHDTTSITFDSPLLLEICYTEEGTTQQPSGRDNSSAAIES